MYFLSFSYTAKDYRLSLRVLNVANNSLFPKDTRKMASLKPLVSRLPFTVSHSVSNSVLENVKLVKLSTVSTKIKD